MKNRIIACLAFLGLLYTQVYAVTDDKAKFGIKGGVNVSTTAVLLILPELYWPFNTDYKYNAGFNMGLFGEFPLTKTLSFQPEFSLSVKGLRSESFVYGKIPTTAGIDTYELHSISNISLYYIQLPLYLKFGFNLNNSSKLIAGLGPYFAYGINGRMRGEFTMFPFSYIWKGEKNIFKEERLDYKNKPVHAINYEWWIEEPCWHNSIKRFDGGISGFIGYELHNRWSITATFDLGLINLLHQTNKNGYIIESKMYNRSFSFSLGYKF